MIGTEAEISSFPSWINKQFIETVLNNGHDETKLIVETIDLQPGCKEGMSHTSNIFRVAATVRRGESATCEKRSIILKCLQENWETKDVPKDSDPTEMETLLLGEVMPEVHRLIRSVEGEAFRPVAPLCYLTGRSPVPFLAIEDLSPAGFMTADPARPLDYQHCAAVMRAYARLHAASARVLKDRPHYKTLCDPKKSVTEGTQQYFRQLSDKIFKAAARQLRVHKGYESYAEKYERLAEKYTRDVFRYWRSSEIRLPVMLHGDCWKNNFMFTYVNENITDVRIIDFQLSKVHSGAADLLYFLYMNASEEVHRDHLDTLLADYHGTLVALLRLLDMAAEADSYPLEALVEDMQTGGACAVFFCALSCMSVTSHKYGAEFEKLFHRADYSGSFLEDAFRNPYSVSYLKYLTPIFDRNGFL
ncbi:uncharacterized protein LOC124595847 [Schistocerca americana]|uniref:uncharacterized protein LOC124595847 n=1 Tax=Schistocerca americana TaxID=7009 RepID=UPI001F4FBCC1|nr:uncharacterized protein LOC124595847 [Schistocerca americana]